MNFTGLCGVTGSTTKLLPNETSTGSLLNQKVVLYSDYLRARGLCYINRYPYLLVKDYTEKYGWRIHLSILKQDMALVLPGLIDLLITLDVPFNLPVNSDVHGQILDGREGLYHTAKVLNVFPGDDAKAEVCAGQLSAFFRDFSGPAVPSAFRISNSIYVSYGPLESETLTPQEKMLRAFPGIFPDPSQKRQLLPKSISWPFTKQAEFEPLKNPILIKGRYVKILLLKDDPKGQVYRCIEIRQLFNLRWCILKLANSLYCQDDYGRDIRTRLKWQFEVMSELAGTISMPRIYDHFELERSSGLIMEYIEGNSLNDSLSGIYGGNSWLTLSQENRVILMNYAIQIIDIVQAIHDKEFIHRDLNPENFLVDEKGKIYLIDFELCYKKNGQPVPPFALGTPGYMSPEQLKGTRPDFPEDIFALCCLLIKIFTDLSPLKFDVNQHDHLKEQLDYFISCSDLTELMVQGTNAEPKQRPDIQSIKHALLSFHAISGSSSPGKSSGNSTPKLQLLPVIHRAIRGLRKGSPISIRDQGSNEIFGLGNGLSGLLYTLCMAKMSGFESADSEKITEKILKFWMNADRFPRQSNSGFFYGNTGRAFMLINLYQAGLISKDHLTSADLQNDAACLSDNLGLSSGLAGDGMLLLHCLPYLQPKPACCALKTIIDQLLGLQHIDGSWSLKENTNAGKSVCVPGLFSGIAGITWFLLAYAQLFKNEQVVNGIKSALEWLKSQRKAKYGHMIWTLNPKIELIDPWLENGFSGIALLFIRAFETFAERDYQEVATSVLTIHPELLSSNYLGFANGIAGLGEIYLEASRVFGDQHWQARADRIAGLLLHTGSYQIDSCITWVTGDAPDYQPAFFSGQAGIIHFLMRYARPDLIGLPFLTIFRRP